MTESPVDRAAALSRERSRKHEALEKGLQYLLDQGNEEPWAHNDIVANNDVAHEHGAFRDDQQPNPDWIEGFLVRARRDALIAKLNTIDILRQGNRIEQSLRDNNKNILFCILLLILLLAIFLGHFWF
jgi:hypothetical protein